MPIRSGLVVVLRVIILLFLFNELSWLVPSIFLGNISKLAGFMGISALFMATSLAGYWLSPAIIDKMMPAGESVSGASPVTVDTIRSVAFSAVGIYIVYIAITQTVSILLAMIEVHSGGYTSYIPSMAGAAISWCFGLSLLLGSRTIVTLLKKLRNAGTGCIGADE